MPGPGFNWVFGGSSVQPANVSYLALALAANTVLVWPPQAPTGSVVAARIMDVTPSGGGFSLSLPPANQASAGADALITNKGASSFTLLANTGVNIATITPGQQYYVYLVDPTTQSGVWNSTLFGTGSSSLSAGAVAGVGLIAIGATLSPNFVTSTTSSTPVNLSATADRSAQYVWTGGAGVFNLPSLAAIPTPDGYFVTINNKGTGTLTIAPNGADTLDGAAATEAMNPGFAATFFASSSGWYSFGPLATTRFNFTELVQTVTGGTLTLTPTQAANVVQKYQGTLTSNQTVVFPPTVQVYYVQNATSGAFTLTFKSGAGSTVTVPTSQNAILFSDGTNVVNASNITGSFGSITLNSGTAASPSLSFSADTSTGLYLPASGQLGFAVGGVQAGVFIGNSLVLGNTAAVFQPFQAATPKIQVYGTAANTAALTLGEYATAFGGAGPGVTIVRSHGATVGAQGALQNGDTLGAFAFSGSDGTNLLQVAQIQAIAEATYTTGHGSTALQYFVNNNSNSIFEAGRTSHLGNWLFGTTADGGQRLQVQGASGSAQVAIGTPAHPNSASVLITDAGVQVLFLGNDAASTGGLLATGTNIPLALGIGGVEKMRVAPTTGNLLLGTTTDTTGQQIFATLSANALTRWTFSNPNTGGSAEADLYVQSDVGTLRLQVGSNALNGGLSQLLANGALTLQASGAHSLTLVTNGAAGITIDSSQNVTATGRYTNTGQAAFSAYRSTLQTSGTTVIFDTINNQQGSGYNSTTGVFTAPSSGWYLFSNTTSYFNNTGATVQGANAEMLINGVTFSGPVVALGTTTTTFPQKTNSCSLSWFGYLTAGQTVSCVAQAGAALSATLYVNSGSGLTFFSGVQLF
jgi:hypothetical protein